MDRILVADDGSAAALRAIEVAVDLAKKTGAELSAIAVVDPGEYRQTEITAFAQSEELEAGEALDTIIDEAAAYVDRCRAIAASHGVSRMQIEKRSGGNPAWEIIDLAREHGVDLVVLGNAPAASPAGAYPGKRLARGGEHRRLLRHDGALIGANR